MQQSSGDETTPASRETDYGGQENILSKGQNSKKGSKKEPAKTLMEKRAAKREKKNEKGNQGLIKT